MAQPTYDSIWKALPGSVLLALIRLVVPNIGAELQPWKTDLKVLFDREIDNAYLVEINGLRVLLLVEYQNYLNPLMPLRMYHYISLLKLQYHQQYQEDIIVIPIVIWAVKGATPTPLYASGISTQAQLLCSYHEIRLSELDWQTIDPILLVLAPFLHGVERADLETAALRMYAAAPSEQQKVLLGAFLNISRRTYRDIDDIEQAILQQVRVTMDEIFAAIAESPIGIKLLAQGEAKGKAEGKAEGEIKAITLLWQRRFGAVPTEIGSALIGASSTQLEQILEAFGDTPTEAEVRAILGM